MTKLEAEILAITVELTNRLTTSTSYVVNELAEQGQRDHLEILRKTNAYLKKDLGQD